MRKNVLITGASGGIGEAMCREFAKNGYNVVIHYNSSEEAALKLQQEIESQYQVKAVPIKADLRKIPIKQETIEICEVFDINPYMLISSGSMLIGCPQGNLLVEKLMQNGINAVVIGRATEGNDRIVVNGDETRYLGPAGSDELYKIYR